METKTTAGGPEFTTTASVAPAFDADQHDPAEIAPDGTIAPRQRLKGGAYFDRRGATKRLLGAGDVIRRTREQLGQFAGRFEQLDPDPAPGPPTDLEVVPAGAGLANVVNKVTGQPINDAPMTAEDAEAFVETTDPEAA